jgi:uncharacterized protein (TIGR02147 family)
MDQETDKSQVDIYAYDDFRLFLKDRYEAWKRHDEEGSVRGFARKAHFSNPGFLNDVIQGRRTLSPDSSKKIIAVFGLEEREADYFTLLIKYSRARSPSLRQEIYRRILFRRNRSGFARLNPAQSRYFQDYRYALVYNALMAIDFRGDYEQLSNFLFPPIPPSQLVKCIADLCEWGLVVRGEDARYRVTRRFIEPPPTLREHVRQLNREWIVQAADALMRLPPETRHISTMMISVSPPACREISRKIDEFRDELWQLVANDGEEPSCVMQLSLQFFPRSRKKGSA